MSTTFLSAVNRILRLNAVIRGDTDTVATFSDVQHNASLNLAIIAVQDELTLLIADQTIPNERKTSGTITLVASQQTYSLASDFTRFYAIPSFYNSSNNYKIFEYPGGLSQLQLDDYKYETNTGQPNWFYFYPTTTDKVGLYLVPNASGQIWTYEYEGSVLVTVATDNLPFHNTEQDNMFIAMAGRGFKYLYEDVGNKQDIQGILEADRGWRASKAALMNLISGKQPTQYYSRFYA